MELKELTTAFAAKMGIDGLTVEDGVCSMTIDDIPMDFTETPDGLAVVGVAVVGEPPPDKREAFYEMLLEANTQLYGTKGIALGKSPDTGEIMLIGGLPFKGLEVQGAGVAGILQGPGRVRQQGRGMARGVGEFPPRCGRSRRPRRGRRPVPPIRHERPRLHERLGASLCATIVGMMK